jgi:hypothetical protein
MAHCSGCGREIFGGAEWCAQCYQSTIERPLPFRAERRTTRWEKSATSFGPLGRVLWTVVLAVPLAVLVYFGIRYPGRPRTVVAMALVLWIGLMIFLLRDIWKAVSIPVRPSGPDREVPDLSNLKMPGAD